MKLILHQALKNVRLLRWLLAAWVALLVALHAGLLYCALVTNVDEALLQYLWRIVPVLTALGGLGFVFIAAVLVQQDSPATTTAQWLTRPAGWWHVLAGKLLAASVVLVALPLALDAADHAIAGADIRWLPLWLMVFQYAWLLPAMAIAAVTTSLAQFVLVALFEGAVCAGLLAAVNALGLASARGSNFPAVFSALAVSGLLVLVHQYATRRTWRSGLLLALAPLGLLAALYVPPAAWPTRPSPAALQHVSVALDGTAVSWEEHGDDMLVKVPLTFEGVAPGMSVEVRSTEAWLEEGGQRVALTPGFAAGAAVVHETSGFIDRAYEGVLGEARMVSLALVASEPRLTFAVRRATLESAGRTSWRLRVHVSVAPYLFHLAARIPLSPGAGLVADRMRVSIISVSTPAPNTVAADVHEVGSGYSAGGGGFCLLRHLGAKRAVAVSWGPRMFPGFNLGPVPQTLHVVRSQIWAHIPVAPQAPAPGEWIGHSDLAILWAEPGAVRTQTVEARIAGPAKEAVDIRPSALGLFGPRPDKPESPTSKAQGLRSSQ
jgi:hypothetical protein